MHETDYMRMPRLQLEHANSMGEGTGSALRMFLVPATPHEDGHIRVEIADQKGKTRFDWENALAADLGWKDCAKLLSVLMGCTEETTDYVGCDNRILIRDEETGIVSRVSLRHTVEPFPGYYLAITTLGDCNAALRQRAIRMTPTEGIGIDGAIRGGLHYVAFGVPVLTEVR